MIPGGKSITTPLGAFSLKKKSLPFANSRLSFAQSESLKAKLSWKENINFRCLVLEKSKISAKGQLVIPKYLRDALGLKEGTEVMIEKSEDKLIIMKKPDDPVKGLVNAAGKVSMKNMRRRIKEE